jgi:hypothetical protein
LLLETLALSLGGQGHARHAMGMVGMEMSVMERQVHCCLSYAPTAAVSIGGAFCDVCEKFCREVAADANDVHFATLQAAVWLRKRIFLPMATAVEKSE